MKDASLAVYTYAPLAMATNVLYGYGGGLNMEAQFEQETKNTLTYGLIKFENVQMLKVNGINVRSWRCMPKDQFEAFEKHMAESAFKLDASDDLEAALKVNWGSYTLKLETGFPVFTCKVAVPQHPYLKVGTNATDSQAMVTITKMD